MYGLEESRSNLGNVLVISDSCPIGLVPLGVNLLFSGHINIIVRSDHLKRLALNAP